MRREQATYHLQTAPRKQSLYGKPHTAAHEYARNRGKVGRRQQLARLQHLVELLFRPQVIHLGDT